MVQDKLPMTTIKQQLYDLLISISWSDLSHRYFGKSCTWLYNRLNGIDRNNQPVTFTEEEKETLIQRQYNVRNPRRLLI